jgi:MFS family permease
VKTNWKYILFAFAGMVAFGLLDNSRGPAFPSIIRQFGVSNTEGSLMFAAASLAGFLMAIPGQRLLAKFGELALNRAFLLMAGVGFLITALSGYMPNGFLLLIAASFVAGLGFGGSGISMNVLVAYGSHESKRRRLFSGLHSMYGLSSVLAPIVFSIFAQNGLDWRIEFLVLSALPFIVVAMSATTKRIPRASEPSESALPARRHVRAMIGIMFSFYVAAEIEISSRLVLYAERTANMSLEDAAMYLSLFFLFLLAGRLAASLIKFPWTSHSMMFASAVVSLIANLAGIFIHPFFLSLTGLTMSYFSPCVFDWISEKYPASSGYMISSVMKWIFLMLFVMHCSVGILTDLLGIRNAMLIGPACLVVTIAMLRTKALRR